jgi:recombination protein RecT
MTNARAAQALGVSPQPGGATGGEEGPAKSISEMLVKLKPQIALALPKHMTADRMSRIVLTEMRKVPKLFQCEQRSLLGAIIQAAQLGLEPGSSLGHAYLLPFENRRRQIIECQLLIGYRGMIELARRSGQIEMIYAAAVYKSDQFSVTLGDSPKLFHIPSEDAEDIPIASAEHLRGAYAVAKMKDGGTQFEWMPIKKIESIRKRSRAKDDGPWVTDFEEMCKKTAVRRLFKYLPVSIELQSTLSAVSNLDTAVDLGESQGLGDIIDGESREVREPPPQPQPEEPNATDKAAAPS